jgi:hypothetical protein
MRSHRVVRTVAVAVTLAAASPAAAGATQDLRSPDTREAAAATAPRTDLRSPDVRDVAGRTVAPAPDADLRSPDARDAAAGTAAPQPGGDLRSPDARDLAAGRRTTDAPAVMVVGVPHVVAAGDGMDWADAGLGAGGALALVAAALAAAFVLGRRRNVTLGRGIASAP